jgi:hypothetical protein
MKSKLERAIQNDSVADRRINAKIATARACLMNNLKWREVFSTLARSVHLTTPIYWRFVRDDRSFFCSVPSLHGLSLLPERLPDELPYPYGPYREIDWIEIPASESTKHNDLDALTSELEALGQLPLSRTEAVLRISGYAW